MQMDEIVIFIQKSPNKVIANHLEALNHCTITRLELKRELDKKSLLPKTIIPNDGDTIVI
jgi:hypothetical protein